MCDPILEVVQILAGTVFRQHVCAMNSLGKHKVEQLVSIILSTKFVDENVWIKLILCLEYGMWHTKIYVTAVDSLLSCICHNLCDLNPPKQWKIKKKRVMCILGKFQSFQIEQLAREWLLASPFFIGSTIYKSLFTFVGMTKKESATNRMSRVSPNLHKK